MDQNPDAHSHYLSLWSYHSLLLHPFCCHSCPASRDSHPAVSCFAFRSGNPGFRSVQPFIAAGSLIDPGVHRHLLGLSVPSPLPKRLSPLLYLLFLFPVCVFFLSVYDMLRHLICTQAARENTQDQKDQNGMKSGLLSIQLPRSTQIRTGVTH